MSQYRRKTVDQPSISEAVSNLCWRSGKVQWFEDGLVVISSLADIFVELFLAIDRENLPNIQKASLKLIMGHEILPCEKECRYLRFRH